MISVRCPHCGQDSNLKDICAGRSVPCPKCKALFTVPELFDFGPVSPAPPMQRPVTTSGFRPMLAGIMVGAVAVILAAAFLLNWLSTRWDLQAKTALVDALSDWQTGLPVGNLTDNDYRDRAVLTRFEIGPTKKSRSSDVFYIQANLHFQSVGHAELIRSKKFSVVRNGNGSHNIFGESLAADR